MKNTIQSLFLAFVTLTVWMSGCAPAPTSVSLTVTPSPSPLPPTFTSEPASTATQAQIIIVEAPGNLESTQDIGCVPISDLKNTYTPPDLYLGMLECVAQDNYPSAAFFFGLAGTYINYDTLRVADITAHDARAVLTGQTLSFLDEAQKEAFAREIENSFQNFDKLPALCAEMLRIGAPQYHPHYMIQHGMNAIIGSNPEDELVKDFDSETAWNQALDAYLHCPNLTLAPNTATPHVADLPILIARQDVPITVDGAEILIVIATNDRTKFNDPFFLDMTSSSEETTFYVEAQVVSGDFDPFAEGISLTDDARNPFPLVSKGWLDAAVAEKPSKPFWEFIVPKTSKSFTFGFPNGQRVELDLILDLLP